MKVKIGDTIYDAEKEPIMVILTDSDKANINRMVKEDKYLCYPDDYPEDQAREFMQISD